MGCGKWGSFYTQYFYFRLEKEPKCFKAYLGFFPTHTSWSYKSYYLQTWSRDISRIMTVTLPLMYRNVFACLYLAEIQVYLEIWVLAAAAPLPTSAKIADFLSKFSRHLLQVCLFSKCRDNNSLFSLKQGLKGRAKW